MLVLFWRMWKAIQDGHASTTPARAVGFVFIPFFNFYWVFRVVWGYAKDYNKFVDRHCLAIRKLNQRLFLACSISMVSSWFSGLFGPGPATVMLLVYGGLFLPCVLQVCDGIDVLRESGPKKPHIRNQKELPDARPAVAARELSLHCVDGEYQGQQIDVQGEIVIGRNAALANLVLASREVSGKHVRVWRDGAHAGAWIEDLDSTNGTFYREAGAPQNAWVQLSSARKLLSSGSRFRLSNDAAEFEIRST